MADNNENLGTETKMILCQINKAEETPFSPFLELPGEIRNKIYRLVLGYEADNMGHATARDYARYDNQQKLAFRRATRTCYKTVKCEFDEQPCIIDEGICYSDTTYCAPYSRFSDLSVDLMFVNRQIRAETLPLVYNNLSFTVFEFATIPFLKDLSCLSRENIRLLELIFTWHSCGPNTAHVDCLARNLRYFTQHLRLKALLLYVDYKVSERVRDVDKKEKQIGWLDTFTAIHASEAPHLDVTIRLDSFRVHVSAHKSARVKMLENDYPNTSRDSPRHASSVPFY